eukprot:TRINITY_DN183_c0_g1_i1.p1 TRINITY_DN183_c0_g1~~TRINITY_DN183_c0_g1_i1.p1  ORF type:complete len:300 (+),score=43.38 TRINITY_DN183_c0_g1_i1:493-1392(+)
MSPRSTSHRSCDIGTIDIVNTVRKGPMASTSSESANAHIEKFITRHSYFPCIFVGKQAKCEDGKFARLIVAKEEGKGFGVRALEHIKKNRLLCRYHGELLHVSAAPLDERKDYVVSVAADLVVVPTESERGIAMMINCASSARGERANCKICISHTEDKVSVSIRATRTIRKGGFLWLSYSGRMSKHATKVGDRFGIGTKKNNSKKPGRSFVEGEKNKEKKRNQRPKSVDADGGGIATGRFRCKCGYRALTRKQIACHRSRCEGWGDHLALMVKNSKRTRNLRRTSALEGATQQSVSFE